MNTKVRLIPGVMVPESIIAYKVSKQLALALSFRPEDFDSSVTPSDIGTVVNDLAPTCEEEIQLIFPFSGQYSKTFFSDNSPRKGRRNHGTEPYQRQLRMARQIAEALNNAQNQLDPRYIQAGRILQGLKTDMKQHGSHLFADQTIAELFLKQTEDVIYMREAVTVQVGIDWNNRGYTIGKRVS